MTAGHIGYWAAVTLGLGCLVVVVLLVVVRLLADLEERRRHDWGEITRKGFGG